MNKVSGLLDFFSIKKRREFTGVGHTEDSVAAGKPGERGCSEKALEIEDNIEFRIAKFFHQRKQRLKAVRFGKEFTVKINNFVEVGMIFKERCKFGTNEPGDFRIREAVTKRSKGRQGKDDIAERAWFYY